MMDTLAHPSLSSPLVNDECNDHMNGNWSSLLNERNVATQLPLEQLSNSKLNRKCKNVLIAGGAGFP